MRSRLDAMVLILVISFCFPAHTFTVRGNFLLWIGQWRWNLGLVYVWDHTISTVYERDSYRSIAPFCDIFKMQWLRNLRRPKLKHCTWMIHSAARCNVYVYSLTLSVIWLNGQGLTRNMSGKLMTKKIRQRHKAIWICVFMWMSSNEWPQGIVKSWVKKLFYMDTNFFSQALLSLSNRTAQ